jgi:zinc finger protein ZFPM1
MCRLCKYRGNTLRGMRMHFKFHLSNNEPCSDDDIIITSTINNSSSLSSSVTTTTTTSSQLLLKCTICSAMFDHEDTLINHIKCVHTKENLLECLECQSRFCSKWNLLRHMKLTHTNIKCDEEEQNDNDEHMITLNESNFIINDSNDDQKLDEDQEYVGILF